VDVRAYIWRLLHDGSITVVGLEGDTLIVFVSIPYLRGRLTPLGDSFALRLLGFRSVEIADGDGKTISTNLADLSNNGLEILGTESDSVPVKVLTTRGHLLLDFDALEVFLDTGRKVDVVEIDTASTAYWTEWEAQIGRKTDA